MSVCVCVCVSERVRVFALCIMVLSVYLSGEMIKVTGDLHMCTPGRQEISHHHCSPPACLPECNVVHALTAQRGRQSRGERLVEVVVVV